MATGEAILPLFDEIWSTQELKVRIKKSSGGTAVDIHYAILQEGLAQAWGILA